MLVIRFKNAEFKVEMFFGGRRPDGQMMVDDLIVQELKNTKK